jgi:hypothetical protein
MANKTSFTPDEWKRLLESVMMAGIAVSAAEPSGLWGTLKESFSSAQAMTAGKSGPSELVKALIADLETSEGRSIAREGLTEVDRNASPVDGPAGKQSARGRRGGESVALGDQSGCGASVEGRRLPRLRRRAGE